MRKLFTFCVAALFSTSAMAQFTLQMNPEGGRSMMLNRQTQQVNHQFKAPAKAAQVLNDLNWGYYTGECPTTDNCVGVNQVGEYGGAIFVPGNTFLKGAKIKAIRIPVVSTDMADTKVWVKENNSNNTPAGTVIAEKATGTLAKGQYHDIYLDEAVELPENGVYVGYTFTTKKDTYAVPFMGTAVENGCWIAFGGEWTDAYEYGFGSICVQVLLDNVTVEESNAYFSDLGYFTAVAGKEDAFNVELINSSSSEVKDIEYTVNNGEETVTKTATLDTPIPSGLNVNGSCVVSVTMPKAVMSSGKVEFNITKVNGKDNASADVAAVLNICTVSKEAHRSTVVEEYTGTGCGYCPRGWVAMERLKEEKGDKFVGVAIHAYNSNDPMYFATTKYAPLGFTGAPQATIDRMYLGDPYYEIMPLFDYLNSQAAKAEVNVNAQWNADTTAVSINADVTALTKDINLEVAFVVTADSLTATDEMTASEKTKWKQSNYFASYQPSGTDELLDQFCKGGIYGKSLALLTFNDVAIASSYKSSINQVSKLGNMSDGDTKNVEYDMDVPLSKILKKAIGDKWDQNIYIVAIVTDNNGYVVNAARKRIEINPSSGIENMVNGQKDATVVARYTLDGQVINTPVKGINILKMSDGSVVKVLVK